MNPMIQNLQNQTQKIGARLTPLRLQKSRELHEAITIDKPHEEVFAFWRNFANLPLFMKDIQKIEVISPEESKWTVRLQSGATAQWTAVITDERPGAMLAWRSLEGSAIETEGAVWFSKAPNQLGTEVQLMMTYKVPGGGISEIVNALTGEDPAIVILTHLKRLKALLETGETPTIEGQPSGRESDSHPVNLSVPPNLH